MTYIVSKNVRNPNGRTIGHSFERSTVATIPKNKPKASKIAHRQPGCARTQPDPGSRERIGAGKLLRAKGTHRDNDTTRLA